MAMKATNARVRASAIEKSNEPAVEYPPAGGMSDELDSDLRQRLISDLAYGRFCARGCVDGYDIEDWLEAEAEVDRMPLNQREAA